MKKWRWSSSGVRHPELLVILLFSFLVRLFLADNESYWLDELYSVVLYGIDHDSAGDAIQALAETSVHPPLYQWILFHWMDFFGHSELATRMLSTLYVVLAIFVLYRFANEAFGKRVAIAAALLFSLADAALFYSLETRSYAQTMLLSVLSMYALRGYLEQLLRRPGWSGLIGNRWFLLFCASNVLLLFTHYYNVFFILAQALFAYLFLLFRSPDGPRAFRDLGKAAMPFVIQAVVFLLAWAGTLKATLERYLSRRSGGGNTTWDGPTQGPLATFAETILSANFLTSGLSVGILSALLLFAFALHMVRIRRRPKAPGSRRAWWWLLVLSCALLPFFFYYAMTAVVGAERIAARYFLFSLAPTALLLVLGFEQLVRLGAHVARVAKGVLPINIAGSGLARTYLRHSTLAAVLLVSLVSAPGAYRAATHEKQDWRGISEQVVQLVQGDPGNSYLVYETSFRNAPTLDYYLERFSGGEIRVHANILRGHERSKKFRFRKDLGTMKESDYLVIVFTHHRERQFRNTLRALSKDFRLVRKNLDETGRGYIVYGQK